MRALLKVSAILFPTLFLSTAAAVAQTGEFASAIPGEVIHRGYALQDEWQRLRSAPLTSRPVGTLQELRSSRTGNAGSHKAARRLVALHTGYDSLGLGWEMFPGSG